MRKKRNRKVRSKTLILYFDVRVAGFCGRRRRRLVIERVLMNEEAIADE